MAPVFRWGACIRHASPGRRSAVSCICLAFVSGIISFPARCVVASIVGICTLLSHTCGLEQGISHEVPS